MFTNRHLKLSFILTVGFLYSGCQLKFNEPIAEDTAVEIQSSKCLKQAKANAKLFFDGDAGADETDQAISCFSQLLISFKDNVKGVNPNGFTQQDLKTVADKNFLKDGEELSLDFVNEIFKFKKALVGGETEFLTKSEIIKISRILLELKGEFVNMAPYIKVIKHEWDVTQLSADEKNQKFSRAQDATLQAVSTLGRYLMTSDGSYKITDFIELLRQGGVFAGTSASNIENFDKAKPVVKYLKISFIGGQDEVLSKDWDSTMQMLHQVLFQYLKYKYFVSDVADVSLNIKSESIIDILKNSLAFFDQLLENKTEKSVSASEMHDLLGSLVHFVSVYDISDNFTQDLTNLKNAFVKQEFIDSTAWTTRDFKQIVNKIILLKPTLISAIVNWDRLNSDLKYENFDQVENQLSLNVSEIVLQIEDQYSLYSAQRFLKEIAQSHMIDSFTLSDKFDAWYQFVLSGKYLVFGQQGARLEAHQLAQFITIGAKFFLHYKQYDLFFKNADYYNVKFSQQFYPFVIKVENTLQGILAQKDTHEFKPAELESLFLSAKETFFEDLKLTLRGFDIVLNTLFENVLISPEARLSGQVLSGINSQSIAILSTEMKSALYSHRVVFSVIPSSSNMLQADYQKLLLDKKTDSEMNGFEIISLYEMIRVAASGISYHFNELNYMRVFEEPQYLINEHDLFKSVLAKAFSKILIRSFAGDIDRINNLTGVTLPEAQVAFDKLRPALIEMEFVQESNLTFISSRFRESSLFVASANGDDYASLEEIHDITLHIYSGLQRADKIQEQVVNKCLPDNHTEIKPETTVAQECLLEQYYQISEGYEGMPKFLDLKISATKELNLNFYLSMLKAAGYVPNESKQVQFADANLYPHVIQYIEMIFSRFDLNRDAILDKDEALAAFPVFKQTIKSVLVVIPNGSKIKDEQLPGVFMYLLKYKKPPKGLAESLKFIKFIDTPALWIITTNRFDLGDIFNFIADATAPKPPVATPPNPPLPPPTTPPVSSPVVVGAA